MDDKLVKISKIEELLNENIDALNEMRGGTLLLSELMKSQIGDAALARKLLFARDCATQALRVLYTVWGEFEDTYCIVNKKK